MLKKLTLVVAALTLSSCETTNVKKAELVQGGTKSGILVKLDGVIPYSQELRLRPTDSKNGSIVANLAFDKNQENYLFSTLKPGRYYIHNLAQQDHWISCFNEDTIAFDIKPDTVTFIGNYNGYKNGSQLQKIARDNGHNTASQSVIYFYTKNILPPQITKPSESDLAEAKAYLAKEAPGITLPVVKAEHSSYSYETKKHLLYRTPTCP